MRTGGSGWNRWRYGLRRRIIEWFATTAIRRKRLATTPPSPHAWKPNRRRGKGLSNAPTNWRESWNRLKRDFGNWKTAPVLDTNRAIGKSREVAIDQRLRTTAALSRLSYGDAIAPFVRTLNNAN